MDRISNAGYPAHLKSCLSGPSLILTLVMMGGKKKIMVKIRNVQVGLRVWSGGQIFSKKIKPLWGAHKAPPPIITKVKVPPYFENHIQSLPHFQNRIQIQENYRIHNLVFYNHKQNPQ